MKKIKMKKVIIKKIKYETYHDFVKRCYATPGVWTTAIPVIGWIMTPIVFGFIVPIHYFISRKVYYYKENKDE